MNSLSFEHLKQLTLAGGSARVLNNLITSELSDIDMNPQWTAFCNVNGQVISTSWITKTTAHYTITCHDSLVEVLTAHIQKHALRNQFDIQVIAAPYTHPDITNIELAIEQQFPIITAMTTAQFIPQMLGMQHHPGSINLNKGCYLGQEIIMRAEQLGTIKRTLRCGTIHQKPASTDIHDTNGKVCGKIINVSDKTPFIFNMVVNTTLTNLMLDDAPITLIS